LYLALILIYNGVDPPALSIRELIEDQSMFSNATFSRATACLAHPFSLAALALLLLNDHLLRVYWPSWWTGKLGDFAWLFFFPFALAAVLALLLPKTLKNHHHWTAALAFSLTASVFALTNTWSAFHTWLLAITSRLLGFQVGWRLDPTDLVALVAMLAAAGLWRAMGARPTRQPKSAWLLLASAGLLTVANSPMPEAGITCLKTIEERLYAFSSYSSYRAEPGGLEWQEAGAETTGQFWRQDCPTYYSGSGIESRILQDPQDENIRYRILPGETIQRSIDGGQSWQMDLQLAAEPEAMQAYYRLRNNGNAEVYAGPFDAAFDPISGSLILAMGHSGVLVRQADGMYRYAPVGIHVHEEPSIRQVFMILMPGEALMAVIIGGLAVLLLWLRKRRFSFRHVLGALAALGWLFIALLLPPALTYSYGQALVMLVLGAAGLLLLPLIVEVLIRTAVQSRPLLFHYLLILLVSSILFLLPFLAWGINVIPNYRLAQVFAVFLTGGWLYWAAVTLVKKQSAHLSPEQAKADKRM
jgi:hypothetical protein